MPILGGGLLRDGPQKKTLRGRARLLLFDPPVQASDLSRIMNQLKRLLLIRLGRSFRSSRTPASPSQTFATTIKSSRSGRCCRREMLSLFWKKPEMRGSRLLTTDPETLRRSMVRGSGMVGCVDSANAQRKCPRHAPGSPSTPGRLQIGMVGAINSLRWATSNRYAWATSSESAAVDTPVLVLSAATSYTDRRIPGFLSEPLGSLALSQPKRLPLTGATGRCPVPSGGRRGFVHQCASEGADSGL
jgi:hypothetical protein